MKDASSKRGLPGKILVALVYLAIGAVVGLANPPKLLFVASTLPIGVLSAVIFKRHGIMYGVVYVIGYAVAMAMLQR